MNNKLCPTCLIDKNITDFHKNKSTFDRLCYECKNCFKVRHKKWRDINIDKVRASGKKWKNNNKEYSKIYVESRRDEITLYKAEYYNKNKKDISIKNKTYREENKELIKLKQKEYRLKYRDKKLKRDRDYYNNNKEEIKRKCQTPEFKTRKREWDKIYYKKRYKEDIGFRLAHSLRTRLRHAIRNKSKLGSAVSDLGCSVEKLKQHLESLFQEGMTWDNYGRNMNNWEIDHIIPLSSYNLENREEFLEACNFTNLQPLWVSQNRSKNNRKVS